ncbi:MAG: type II toxin-antitoxin system antitoxin SocA domain-containing protein, partial [Minisyncoccales bacterium]
QKLKGEVRGKKKLAKLLYFVDFGLYEKDQKSVTGDIYRALPMGPVPMQLEKIIGEMEDKKLISIEKIEERQGYLPTEVYRCKTEPDNGFSIFERLCLVQFNPTNPRQVVAPALS